jgi:hypothetical protein
MSLFSSLKRLIVKCPRQEDCVGECDMADIHSGESCGTCQHCGAEIKEGVCASCKRDPDSCICERDVTSSTYPM